MDIPDDEKARGKTRQKISDNIGALENQRQLALVAGTDTVDLRYRIAVAKRNYLMFQPLHRQLENGKKSRDTAKERLEAALEAAKIAAENVKAIKAAISVWDAGLEELKVLQRDEADKEEEEADFDEHRTSRAASRERARKERSPPGDGGTPMLSRRRAGGQSRPQAPDGSIAF